jgi:energy-coupling factor transporter ATP-binding protein EcfA2
MKIEELETSDIKINKTQQNIDELLDIKEPFLNRCGTTLISGRCGSGKSTLLYSMFSGKGKARVYRNVFDEIHFITPEAVMNSECNHPFQNHNPDRLYHHLNAEVLAKIVDDCMTAKEEGKNSCLVIDDMSEFYKDKSIEQLLRTLIYKHRHLRLNIVLSSLNLKSVPKNLRNLIDLYVIFKPSNIEIESFNDDVFQLSRDDLKQLVAYVFEKPYDFLAYNQKTNTFYKNMTKLKLL